MAKNKDHRKINNVGVKYSKKNVFANSEGVKKCMHLFGDEFGEEYWM